MPKGRTRTTTTTNESQNSNATTNTTGTPFANDILQGAAGNDVLGQVFAANDGGYQGNREAGMNVPTSAYQSTWGAMPTNFVPQRTTGDQAQQQTRTNVDVNYQPGITAGLDNANAQAGQLTDISNAGLAGVQTAIGSPHQGLDEMLTALQGQHNIASAQSTNAMAEVAGQNGAFGGTSFARDNAMQQGELQRAFNDQAAQLLWQDQARQDEWLRTGAATAGAWAGVGDINAQRQLNYGGLQLQNDQNAVNTDYFNRTADATNAFTQGTLNDSNTASASQDAIAAWEAAHQVSVDNNQTNLMSAALDQANAQTGMNNDYYRWAGGQESLDQLLQRLQQMMGTAASAPGGTQTGSATGQSTSTQVTQQPDQTLATLGSLLGAGMQAFGGGGFGALTGAGAAGAAAGAGGASGAFSALLPLIFASERRLKTNIVPLFTSRKGIPWYAFEYRDQPGVLQTGVMEDEVRYIPGAVKNINGINHVDHGVLANWEAA